MQLAVIVAFIVSLFVRTWRAAALAALVAWGFCAAWIAIGVFVIVYGKAAGDGARLAGYVTAELVVAAVATVVAATAGQALRRGWRRLVGPQPPNTEPAA